MRFITEMLGSCGCVADIGTDHGLIPIYMVLSGMAEKAILSDIAKGPLARAEENLALYCDPSDDRFSLRLGAGLDSLEPAEADGIIIAGMGGETIAEILSESPDIARSAKRLVLQPRTKCSLLRRWLDSEGYSITEERLAEENGHIAQILTAVPEANAEGSERFSEGFDYEIPPMLIENNDPLLLKYLDNLISQAEAVVESMEDAQDEASGLSLAWTFRLKELIDIKVRYEEKRDL